MLAWATWLEYFKKHHHQQQQMGGGTNKQKQTNNPGRDLRSITYVSCELFEDSFAPSGTREPFPVLPVSTS